MADATNNSGVIGKASVAMQFNEISNDVVNVTDAGGSGCASGGFYVLVCFTHN
jgi:hypothetical protein